MIALLDQEEFRAAELEDVGRIVRSVRLAQAAWSRVPIPKRCVILDEARRRLADNAASIAGATAAVCDRPVAEKLSSEVLPLLDAFRFAHRNAPAILRTHRHGRKGRPLWLHGASFEVQRKAHGVVLIIAPGNYPLFLPGVQLIQALVAGNGALIKPAEGASEPLIRLVRDILVPAGIPEGLVELLPECPRSAHLAIRVGVDRVIFTGSSENGRDLLGELAATLTPAVMELSGADTVLVRADADLDLAAAAVAFGLRLNAGNTCMAPQSIIAHASVAAALDKRLQQHGVSELRSTPVRSDQEALELAALDQHGLGASIFSRNEDAARALAAQLNTGFVTINDIIVPTADPRLPFGGRGESGFGCTRGAEGLLDMTYPHVVSVRRARRLLHLAPPRASDEEIFSAFIRLLHGSGFSARVRALAALVSAAWRRGSSTREKR